MQETFADMGSRHILIFRSRGLHLLTSLVLLMLVSPFFEGTHTGHIVVDALLSLVLLATISAAKPNRRIQIVFLVLAIVAMLLMWTNVTDQSGPSRLAGLLFYIAINVAAIGLVLRQIIFAPTVNFEVLCAGIGLYLLIGVTWTLIYILMDTIEPGSFATISPSLEKGWSDYLYFSFATLTTLGYGDISPDVPVARVWAVSEAIAGVLYIAVLVARLVSLYRE